MKALKQELAQAGLEPDLAQAINNDLEVVDTQAHKPRPNRIILMNRLKSVIEMLSVVEGASVQ